MKMLLTLAFAVGAISVGLTQPAPEPTAAAPVNPFEGPELSSPPGALDRLILDALQRAGSAPPARCSDAVFVRRVYLDAIGTLPTADEARQFIRNSSTGKRRALIDRLLEREEFAVYWAMKWGDLLRIKAEFPVNLWPNAAQAYHRWVLASLAANKAYHTFVRELLTSSGSNFRVGPVNFYRALQNRTPEGIATAVALTFMGARAESWPSNRLADLTVFFSQIGYKPTSEWKEEHVFWDPLGTSTAPGNSAPGRAAVAPASQATNRTAQASIPARTMGAPSRGRLPDGTEVELPPDRDPREIFADWLITPQNPWFTRNIANRVWAWLLGRGIIHEPDDLRPDNPPAHPELLAFLEGELVTGGYDLKRLYRLILNSAAYQSSTLPRADAQAGEASYASYALRRLDAEVLIDALNQVTGASDLYTSPIPEPFTYIPEQQPAVALADGSITSPFLALFGRSARATGMENERDNKPVPAQWLHLLNSSHIQRKLEQGPKLKALIESRRPPREVLDELYLTTLSRYPTSAEVQLAAAYGAAAAPAPANRSARPAPGKRREDWLDLTWALINSTEFLYRH